MSDTEEKTFDELAAMSVLEILTEVEDTLRRATGRRAEAYRVFIEAYDAEAVNFVRAQSRLRMAIRLQKSHDAATKKTDSPE
jgi:hypothetical protein